MPRAPTKGFIYVRTFIKRNNSFEDEKSNSYFLIIKWITYNTAGEQLQLEKSF